MADIVLFGASGFTGRLVAGALGLRGASYAVAGRDLGRLEAVARAHGAEEVRAAAVGEVDGLVRALRDARVLVSCVGPFAELGATAVEAALEAGVHYLDCTGEASFVAGLVRDHAARAEDAGVAVAPAMGFDEVPADVAATLAVAGSSGGAELVLTYAMPSGASRGTIRSAVGALSATVPWDEGGVIRQIGAGERRRWAPMPPPLGPRLAVSFPLAEAHLAPLHLDVGLPATFVTAGRPARVVLGQRRAAAGALATRYGRTLVERLATMGQGPADGGPSGRWTILAEARWATGRRNVVIAGRDPYGLTAQTMAAAAVAMAEPGYPGRGVMAPVGAVGLEPLKRVLESCGATIESFEPI
ncbi:MAG: saccharopine dehydrogenase NADP-binding domain-containing protein [Actinobacteria bacterium]|nr:saccharopine dehydrogenase NADP-binding domain-containing protein [Actinomycetota bacterium]